MEHNEMIGLILSLAGVIILMLISILGWFLARVIGDVRKNTEEIGKNKGRIELVEQQQINDTKRIEAMTQLELRNMSTSINKLSENVNVLVTALAKRGIDHTEL